MARRKIEFHNGGVYHVYNRGVEKRDIVSEPYDQLRFLRSLNIFNTTEPVGGIFVHDLYESGKRTELKDHGSPLVEIIAFNLLDNHYHLVLRQLEEQGVSTFIKSVGMGYAKYFNEKYDRVGPLFQGVFKAAAIGEDRMEEIVSYVNLNHVVHELEQRTSQWGIRSSLMEYEGKRPGVVRITKWSGFNKKRAVDIVTKIRRLRKEEAIENEFQFQRGRAGKKN